MRILIVDNDPAVGDTLAGLLEPLGHEVVRVTDGHAALDRFRRDRYDLVVVDVVMPEMNGLEVMRKVRALDPTARLVALTGTGLDFSDVLPAIGIRFMHKPIGTPAPIADLLATREASSSVASIERISALPPTPPPAPPATTWRRSRIRPR